MWNNNNMWNIPRTTCAAGSHIVTNKDELAKVNRAIRFISERIIEKAHYSAADHYLQIREQGAFGVLFSLTHPNGHSSEYLRIPLFYLPFGR